MSYRWVDHTAELELHVDATTEDAIFAEALRALAELVGEGSARRPASFDVELTAGDRATLLATWLDELVYRAEVDGLVPEAVERLALEEDRLVATVRGHEGEPRHLVKGVTYQRLGFEPIDGGYHATVVLDV